jgi:hypothetical protein
MGAGEEKRLLQKRPQARSWTPPRSLRQTRGGTPVEVAERPSFARGQAVDEVPPRSGSLALRKYASTLSFPVAFGLYSLFAKRQE